MRVVRSAARAGRGARGGRAARRRQRSATGPCSASDTSSGPATSRPRFSVTVAESPCSARATARSSDGTRSSSRSRPLPASTRAPGRGSRRRAVAFAEAIGYESAGTAEFLVDGPDVYFLELNGRIQVEHPVTEEVTGLDIVELQLRVAAGEPVELDVHPRGHAIEARLYAEDPRTFLPQTGRIRRLVLPGDVRVDAGVEEGDEIGLSYDPMIAKLIAHGADRDEAIARLERALDATVVEGVTTNLPFLRWLVRHPAFRAGWRLDGVPTRPRAPLGRRRDTRHRPRSRTRGG